MAVSLTRSPLPKWSHCHSIHTQSGNFIKWPLSQPLPLALYLFVSLSVFAFSLHFHHRLFYLFMRVQAGAHTHTHKTTSDFFPLFNLLPPPPSLFYFFLLLLLLVAHRPPAARQTQTHTHTYACSLVMRCVSFLSAWSSNTQVLAQSKQPCLRCKGYNSPGIRGRIWTGGTNKPQAWLPSLSLSPLFIYFFALIPHSVSLFPRSQFIKSQLIFQGVWSGEWEEGIANRQKRLCHFMEISLKRHRTL